MASAYEYINLRQALASTTAKNTDLQRSAINSANITIEASPSAIIILPTIGSYVFSGKVFAYTALDTTRVQPLLQTSTNNGSTWSSLQSCDSLPNPNGNSCPIYGFLTTTVVNQKCKITLWHSEASGNIALSTNAATSFLYVYKTAPF